MATHLNKPRFVEDDWRAIRALNAYRWIIAVGLTAVFFSGFAADLFELMWPELFGIACLSYLTLCVPAALASYTRKPGVDTQIYLLIGADIVFVTALVMATAGVEDGLGMLLLAPIAGAAILVPRRIAALLAAIASMSLLLEEAWRTIRFVDETAEWVQAGILGGLIFILAMVANALAIRARSSAALAATRKTELEDLSTLNDRIIQHMQIGLLVVDEGRHIRLINRAARNLLGLKPGVTGRELPRVAPALAWALKGWVVSPHMATEPFIVGNRSLVPHFTRLGHGLDAPVLIFLEDAQRISEAAQQMKLAALGRLTAGIAHEIRNPLSAISHAGQLLDETAGLGEQEKRLLDILHRHTARIDEIVQGVLGLSRRGEALPRKLNLAQWLPQTIADYREGRSDAATLEARAPEDMTVRVDPNHLRQVLYNLWDNAERHARCKDRELIVRVYGGYTDDNEPYLDIADNGPGVDKNTAKQLMEPFFTTARDGTGLGLYLARELCESNGAHIHLHPSQGVGACFRILFAASQSVDDRTQNLASAEDNLAPSG